MKRMLKVLFGRSAIVVILLLLQLLFIFSTTLRIIEGDLYRNLSAAVRLVSVLVMLYILNTPGNQESKLAWVIQISVFPLLGTFFFLFTQGQTRVPTAFNRELKRMRRENRHGIAQDPAVLEDIKARDARKHNLVKYMNDCADMAAFDATEVTYLPTGEAAWASILRELEKAERYIFIEFFIIEEGSMWNSILEILRRKAAEGVDVRVMYDGVGCLTRLPHSYPKKLEAMGIRCRVFNPFRPFLTTIQNNRDHRKLIAIDGRAAFTGGMNLADEYVNLTSPYGHWKDSAVLMQGDAAFAVSVMFLEFWQIASRERTEDYSAFMWEGETPEARGWVMPYCDSPFDCERVGESVYLDIITKAKSSVYITTPYMIIDSGMMNAIGAASKSGVDIKMIVPHMADHWYAHAVAKAYYARLIELGVELYEYMPGFIHSKSFVSDGEVAVVGSINMDYRSFYLQFESAAWFYDCPAVGDVERDFLDTVKKCRPITLESCRTRGLKKLLYAVLRLFAPLM